MLYQNLGLQYGTVGFFLKPHHFPLAENEYLLEVEIKDFQASQEAVFTDKQAKTGGLPRRGSS